MFIDFRPILGPPAEPKNAKSNYWLQTLILDKKNSKFKNKILKEFHKKKVFSRPTWQLISDLKPYRNNQSHV